MRYIHDTKKKKKTLKLIVFRNIIHRDYGDIFRTLHISDLANAITLFLFHILKFCWFFFLNIFYTFGLYFQFNFNNNAKNI